MDDYGEWFDRRRPPRAAADPGRSLSQGLNSVHSGRTRSAMKVGRNDPCPCGSGKKYKKCCLAKDEAAARQDYAQHAATQREVARAFDLPPLPEPPPPPPPNPLEQAR